MASRRVVDVAMVGLGAASLIFATRLGWPEPTLGLATVAWTGLLLLRDRFGVAPLGVPVVLALRAVLSPPLVPPRVDFPVLVLVGWLVGFGASDWRRLVGGVVVIPPSVAVMRYPVASGHPRVDTAYISAIVLGSMLFGAVTGRRGRQALEAQERFEAEQLRSEEHRRVAVAQERARIARELHDVISHSVSTMTVQAGSARILLAGGDRDGSHTALCTVEQMGHDALDEMRRLLGVLRHDMGIQPAPAGGFERLPALVEEMNQRGLAVELSSAQMPDRLPYGLEVTAYRVVKEALDAVVGAGGTNATVLLRASAEALVVQILAPTQIGTALSEIEPALRRRVELYGGDLLIGTREGQRMVRARLPLEPGSG